MITAATATATTGAQKLMEYNISGKYLNGVTPERNSFPKRNNRLQQEEDRLGEPEEEQTASSGKADNKDYIAKEWHQSSIDEGDGAILWMLLIQSPVIFHYRQIGIFGTSIYVLHLFSLREFLEIDGSFFLFQILLNFSVLIFKLGGSVATNKKKKKREHGRGCSSTLICHLSTPWPFGVAVYLNRM